MSLDRFVGFRSGLLQWLLLAHMILKPASAFETANFSNTSTSGHGPSITPTAYPTTSVSWIEAPLRLTTITIDILPNISVRWYGGPIPGTDLQAPGFVPELMRPTHLVTSYMSPLRPHLEYYTGPTTVEIRGSTISTTVLTLEINPENTVDMTKKWNGTQTTYSGPFYRDTTIVLSGPTSIVTMAIVGNQTVVSPPFALQTVDSLAQPSPPPSLPSQALDPLPSSTGIAEALESQTTLGPGSATTENSLNLQTMSQAHAASDFLTAQSPGAEEPSDISKSTPTIHDTTATQESQPALASERQQTENLQITSTESLVAGADMPLEAETSRVVNAPVDMTAPPSIITETRSRSVTDTASLGSNSIQHTSILPSLSVSLSGSNIEVLPIDSTRVLVGTVTAPLGHNTIYISSTPVATLEASALSQISAHITSEAILGSYIWQALGGGPAAGGSAEVTRIGTASEAGETKGSGSLQTTSFAGPSPVGTGQVIAVGSAKSPLADCGLGRRVLLIAGILIFSKAW